MTANQYYKLLKTQMHLKFSPEAAKLFTIENVCASRLMAKNADGLLLFDGSLRECTQVVLINAGVGK